VKNGQGGQLSETAAAANYPAHLRKTYHLGRLICSSTPFKILEFVFNFSKQSENVRVTWFFLWSTKDQLKIILEA
jgi:hypothetical protein